MAQFQSAPIPTKDMPKGIPHIIGNELAEVMVSITCREFSCSQAPRMMKSVIMSDLFLSIALGYLVRIGVNIFIQNPDGSLKIDGADYFYFFADLMFITALLFVVISRYYKATSFYQEEISGSSL